MGGAGFKQEADCTFLQPLLTSRFHSSSLLFDVKVSTSCLLNPDKDGGKLSECILVRYVPLLPLDSSWETIVGRLRRGVVEAELCTDASGLSVVAVGLFRTKIKG